MNQREVLRKIWERRKKTLASSPQAAKAEAFFQLVEEQPNACWEELVDEFRRNYYDAVEIVASVLLETDDPLIIYNCIRFSDQSRPQEIAALQRVARDCDCERHHVSLLTLANTKAKAVTTTLGARKDLPQMIRAALKSVAEPSAPGKKKIAGPQEKKT
jgi:hypothetical protein